MGHRLRTEKPLRFPGDDAHGREVLAGVFRGNVGNWEFVFNIDSVYILSVYDKVYIVFRT